MRTQLYKHENLDYLSGTMEWVDVPLWDSWVEIENKSPIRNYNRTIRYASGMLQMYSTKDKNVGTHIVLSGNTLNVLRGEGNNDTEIIQMLRGMHVKFSRVDIAVTSKLMGYIQHTGEDGTITEKPVALAHPFQPHDMINRKGSLISRLAFDNPVVDADLKAQTCYIGSRKARNRLFRAYDKGLELGKTANTIIRYEMETRKNPDAIIRAIESGNTMSSIIRRYVDFDVPEWLEIMSEDVATMPQLEDGQSEYEKRYNENISRWDWLVNSVSQTIAKAIVTDIELRQVTEYENDKLHELKQAIDDNVIKLLNNRLTY